MRAIHFRGLGALLLCVLAVAATEMALQRTLFAPTFLTGWILAAPVLWMAAGWWSPPRELEDLALRMRGEVALSLAALAAFLVHIDLRLPRGWIESALFSLVIAVGASLVIGRSLALERDERRRDGPPEGDERRTRRRVDRERRVGRWLRVHVALVWTLLALGLFHGAFVHLHGLLAHLFLYGEAGS